jgi:transcriptional regulator with XRE-family HTH domain
MLDQRAVRSARRALGQQLAALRQHAGYSQQKFARQVDHSRSSQANIETGYQKGSRDYWRRCDELLRTDGRLTAAYDEIESQIREQYQAAAHALERDRANQLEQMPVRRSQSVRERVNQAAGQSLRFLTEWESRSLSRDTVDEFVEDLRWLAREYVHRPIDQVFDDLVDVRDRACRLLGEPRRTADTRTLLLVTGLACGMLAHASIDLGDRRAAADQVRVAVRFASEAGHHGLLAWSLGTQSLIAYCLRQSERAVDYAVRGQRYASSGTGATRLAALKARALAAHGNAPAAKAALREVETLAERTSASSDLEEMGGILTFRAAKQHYYKASTAALLADGRAAQVHAKAAVAAYESAAAAECSYGDLALSRVTLAQAHLLATGHTIDLEAAATALAPVFALPEEKRIAGLHRPLRKVQLHLEHSRVRDSSVARELSARIEVLLDGTRAISPA